MTAGISTAIAGLKNIVATALAVAAFATVFAMPARASELAALPDASLCNVILTTGRTAIDQSPHWAAHRAEAVRRGLDLAACRLRLGFPEDVPSLLINLDDRTLCEGALDKEREGWEEAGVWRPYREEATRRALDIAACRVAVGLQPSLEPAIRSATDAWLCGILLNASRTAFDTLPEGAPARVEAQRRKLDLAACRVALGFPAEPGPAEKVASLADIEKDNCKAALEPANTAFSNSPQARAARAVLEKAGRTARDCRKILDIRIWPITVMLVAVEQGKKISVRQLAVTDLRCHALVSRLDRAIARGKALRESITADGEASGFTVLQSQQLGTVSSVLTMAFGMPAALAEAAQEAEGRVRAVGCISPSQVSYSRIDARAADRQYSARIERVNASEVSLKGELGIWQYPELIAELLVSEPPRRLAINSNGGQTFFALLLAEMLTALDIELVVRKGAECHSSCAILAALVNGRAIVSRKASIGVHRSYDIKNGKPTREGLEEAEQIVAQALVDAGVTYAFIERMNNERSITRTAPVRERDATAFGLQWRWTD